MRPRFSVLFAAALPLAVLAEDPWGRADPALGKALHDKACVSCHVRMYGGDGSRMYTRDNRLLSSKLELLQRVATCNAMVRAGWSPEEEGTVAAWLNQEYYHFKQ